MAVGYLKGAGIALREIVPQSTLEDSGLFAGVAEILGNPNERFASRE